MNPINIQGVMSDFTNSNFCQTYKVNRFEEQIENLYVARLNNRVMPFGG